MKKLIGLIILPFILLQGCSSDDDTTTPDRTLLNTFNIELSAQYSVPANMMRMETGMAEFKLYDDNSLDYTITVNNLLSTDMLTVAHIHTGDLVSTGGVLIGLVDGMTNSFDGNSISASMMLTDQQVIDLTGSDIYLNVHSIDIPSGLLRGSVDKQITFSMDIDLSTQNTVPMVMGRNETGVAYLRLDSEGNLFYKIMVNDLDMTDMLTVAHIHSGMTGIAGPVVFGLAGSSADIGVTKMLMFNDMEETTFLNNNLYINVHSMQQPSGLIRGQIR